MGGELEKKDGKSHHTTPSGTPPQTVLAQATPSPAFTPPAAGEAQRHPAVAAARGHAAEASLKNKPGSDRGVVNQPSARAMPGFDPAMRPAQMEALLLKQVEGVRAARATPGGPEEVSKRVREPMLAGVMDMRSGGMFTAGNTERIPERLHPIMKARLEAEQRLFDAYRGMSAGQRSEVAGMKPEDMAKFLKAQGLGADIAGMDTARALRLVDSRMRFKQAQLEKSKGFGELDDAKKQSLMAKMWGQARGEIGTHGEFSALNAALLARQDAQPDKRLVPDDLKSFMLHNTYSDPRGSDVAAAMQRCQLCEALTGGVTTSARLAHADSERDAHEKK